MWMLEVQRNKMEGFVHVGYMRAIFRSKSKAAAYYKRHNLHMRDLNAHGTWRSDWDPETMLRYAVRRFDREVMTIPPFDPADEPQVRKAYDKNGAIFSEYTKFPTFYQK